MPNNDWKSKIIGKQIWLIHKIPPKCKIRCCPKPHKVNWLEGEERSISKDDIILDAQDSEAWQQAEITDI